MLATLDYAEDYDLIKALHEEVGASVPEYGAREIIAWIGENAELHEKCVAVRGEGGD